MQVYDGAHFVPISVPDSCSLTFHLIQNNYSLKTISNILSISLVGTDFLSLFSSACLILFKPDSWGILGYKPTKSAVTRTDLLQSFTKYLRLTALREKFNFCFSTVFC